MIASSRSRRRGPRCEPGNTLVAHAVVFVSREVWPFVEGGGIGRYISDAIIALAGHADVTILTTDRFAARYRELVAADHPRSAAPT